MQHGPRVRQRLDQLAGAARVVEVHVGQEQVIDLLARDTEFVQRREQPWGSRRGAGIHERGPAVVHDEVTRGQARADVVGIDQVHAIAHRDGVGPGACVGVRSNRNRGHEGGRVVDSSNR